jgi:hypothetical protein
VPARSALNVLDRALHALSAIALSVAVASSIASCSPVLAPLGTAARPMTPFEQ